METRTTTVTQYHYGLYLLMTIYHNLHARDALVVLCHAENIATSSMLDYIAKHRIS